MTTKFKNPKLNNYFVINGRKCNGRYTNYNTGNVRFRKNVLFIGIVQAFVFTILSSVYVSEALGEEE